MSANKTTVKEGYDVVVAINTTGNPFLWCNSSQNDPSFVGIMAEITDVQFADPSAAHNGTQVLIRADNDDRINGTQCGFQVVSFQCTAEGFATAFKVRVRALLDGKVEGDHNVTIAFYVTKTTDGELCTVLVGSILVSIPSVCRLSGGGGYC